MHSYITVQGCTVCIEYMHYIYTTHGCSSRAIQGLATLASSTPTPDLASATGSETRSGPDPGRATGSQLLRPRADRPEDTKTLFEQGINVTRHIALVRHPIMHPKPMHLGCQVGSIRGRICVPRGSDGMAPLWDHVQTLFWTTPPPKDHPFSTSWHIGCH